MKRRSFLGLVTGAAAAVAVTFRNPVKAMKQASKIQPPTAPLMREVGEARIVDLGGAQYTQALPAGSFCRVGCDAPGCYAHAVVGSEEAGFWCAGHMGLRR